MHGRKRDEYKARLKDPKTAAALSQKAQQWYALQDELKRRRQQQRDEASAAATDDDDKEEEEEKGVSERSMTLTLMEKALLVNPDPLSLWNHRRELILLDVKGKKKKKTNNDDEEEEKATDNNNEILTCELALTQAALKRNPKAYGAWFHRKWILALLMPNIDILRNELTLTAQFFTLDERNFHCWNYRRFVVSALAGC